ncbi:hypothetical protein BH11PSE11_BH11PSE11_33880 [soil metagenome]
MISIFKNHSLASIVRVGMTAITTAFLMTSCGGGGGSPGTVSGSGGISKAGIAIELVDASTGVAKDTLSTSGPLTARAIVKDSSGNPAANTVVNFELKGGGTTVGVLTPSAGTALTDANGVATITISVTDLVVAQAQSGAAESITASATIGTQALTATSNYRIGVPAVSLKLVTPSTGTVNIAAYQSTLLQVDVVSNGSVFTAQPVSVNFTSACAVGGKASLAASATTSNGRAQVVYTDKGCAGADKVTISTAGAPSLAVNIGVAAPVAASIGFVSATPADKAIVIQGSGGSGRTETAILTFLVLDTFGLPLPNQQVNFTVNSSQPVFMQSNSAISGTDGKVTLSVNSGTQPTTFRVIATLLTGQSTISDTITVTTGQPVQAAFSLSVETFNIEGFNHDNEKTKVNILMADQFGNPVADGTPVVFQTDSGAIGSSSVGGCVTANGACSVDFRSQAPRYGVGNTVGKRAGLATIDVSSTSALYSLTAQTGIFLSGSTASNVFVGNLRLAGSPYTITKTDCTPVGFRIEVNDVNFNPMPIGTKIEAVNNNNLSITGITPDKVPNVQPHPVTGGGTFLNAGVDSREGSTHNIALTTTGCTTAGATVTGQGSFDIMITSPLGSPVLYPVIVNFPVAFVPNCQLPQVLQNGQCVSPPSVGVTLTGTTPGAVGPSHTLNVDAFVRDGQGNPVPNTIVTYTIANTTLATVAPGSSLTNPAGHAFATISKAGAGLGSTSITATVTVNGLTTSTTVNFNADNN